MSNLIIQCKSKYDVKALKAFNKYNMYSKILTKIVSVLAVILLCFAVLYNTDTNFRILIGFIAIMWFAEILVLPGFYARKILKTSKVTSDAEVEVKFYEDRVTVNTVKNGESIGNTNIEYDDIYKIAETKKAMYIYISENQAFLCTKANFDGDYSKLNEVLKEKLGKKYKVKKV